MDGTLIDTDQMIIESFHQLYDLYKGGNRRKDEEIIYFSGPPIRETLKNEFPEQDQQFMLDEFHRICYPLYSTHIFRFEHSIEVLERLKKDGFKLAIVTNKMHELSLLALQKLNLESYFDIIIGFDDVSKGKPDKEGILKAIDLLSSKLESSIYIGDNESDLLTANNAGIDCALVNWGPRHLPHDIKAKFRFNSYLELEELLYE